MENKSDLEYDYIQSLCEAIEHFTKEAERSDGLVFVYRGANLKYALERIYYFSFLNNKRLIEIFKQWRSGKLPKKINLINQIEEELVILLCNKELPTGSINVMGEKELVKFLIRKISKLFLLDKIIELFIRLTNFIHFKKSKNAPIIITLVHEKFINYLKPITNNLNSDYEFLSIYARVNNFLLGNKLPFIKIPMFGYRLKNFIDQRKYLSDAGLTLQYDIIYDALNKLKPKTVVVIEGNAANNEVSNQACKQLGIKTICIQQGWSPIIHNGFRNMSYSKMLVWGNGFAELLSPYNPEQKFVAVGSHVLHPPTKTKNENLKKQKAISFFISAPSGLLTPKIWDYYLNLIMWTAKELRGQKIIVSDDPVQPLSEDKVKLLKQFDNLTIVSPSKQKLKDTLDSSDVTVLIMSTIILESIAADVLPIIFNITSLPNFFPDVNSYGAGIEVKNYAEAQKILKRVSAEEDFTNSFKPAMEKFRKKFFSEWGENAVKKILEEIRP